MRKIHLSKELLNKLYTEQNMTLNDIANELGVSRQTVSNKLKEYDITIRNSEYIAKKKKQKAKFRVVKKEPLYKNKEDFQKVYSELKALDLVAKHYGISHDTAYVWKNRHNIKTIREFSQRGRKLLNVDKPYANKEWLEKMYEQYSFEDLGKMLNCSPSTISKWAQRFGIQSRSISEQWEVKTKKGNQVVKKGEFDLQLYKETYVIREGNLNKGLKQFIIDTYGKCECCGETEVLDLHHIDENHSNNSPENHGVLCPNCHAKIHRLGVKFNELVKEHTVWTELIDSYQEAK